VTVSGFAIERYWPRLFWFAAPSPGNPSTNFRSGGLNAQFAVPK
jgi:hypothetical protein